MQKNLISFQQVYKRESVSYAIAAEQGNVSCNKDT